MAAALGVGFAAPRTPPGPACDLVVHTSATVAGLQLSLDLLGAEGTVLELSWYGDRAVSLELGGAFHSGRLAIRASQVGDGRRRPGGRAYHRRPARARLDLLRDPAFDALMTGGRRFEELPG